MTHRLRADHGTITVLLTGILVVILMIIAVGASITGVHLERNRLQAAADAAALAASQAYPETAFYDGDGPRVSEFEAAGVARDYLQRYPHRSTRTRQVTVDTVTVADDGTVTVRLVGVTDPPLIGWVTRSGALTVGLDATGTARSR